MLSNSSILYLYFWKFTIIKYGRFSDIQHSYSYLHPNDNLGSPISSPDNFILEQRVSSVNISSINKSGTLVTVTTVSPHGFLVGDGATISDVIHAQGIVYNGNYKVKQVLSPTSFTYESKNYLTPTEFWSSI